jgi:nucleoside triphosphate diphosphatase
MYQLDDLLYLMQRLREPQMGCPWDTKQTMQSITPYTIEEVYELVDAIEQMDNTQIQEELGDVLFQVVFYAQIAKEQQQFDFKEIIHNLVEKLIRRHPHVFLNGDLYGKTDEQIDEQTIKQRWEEIKQQERADKQWHGLLADIPKALPALKRAQKIQKRVAKIGFDWTDALAALSKVKEEITELEQALLSREPARIQEEMGDVIFSCVNVARHLQVDAEQALQGCNKKFEKRFAFIEQALAEQGRTVEQSNLLEMDDLWQQSKRIS